MEEPGLKPFDSPLCVSSEQKEKINSLREEFLQPTQTYWRHGYAFSIREDDPDFASKMASTEEPPEYLSVIASVRTN